MQQFLNPNKAASSTDLMKEKGEKNGKDKMEEAGTMMIFEPFLEAPLHVLLVSPKHVHHRSRIYRSILTDFLPLYIICHIAHTHTHKKWTKIYAINFTLPSFHIFPQTVFIVDTQMCFMIIETDEQ